LVRYIDIHQIVDLRPSVENTNPDDIFE